MARRPRQSTGEWAEGGVAVNPIVERAAPFIKRIENLIADRDSERGESMARCRRIADDIKEVYSEAKGAGLNVKSLKGHVKRRRLEAKIAAIPAEFDIDEQSQYDALCANAEAFKGTPMGDHARERAEAMRPDEANLTRIGRGREQPSELVDGLTH